MTKLKVILPYLMCMTVLVAFGETTVGAAAEAPVPQATQTKPDSEVKEATSMPKKDADLEKERLLKEQVAPKAVTPIQGEIVHYREFPSEYIRPRPVDVWLPEGYDSASSDRYPVLYMHDGQMMFHLSTSPYAGMDLFWDVDKAITRLAGEDEIRPAIVVSVWMADWAKGARGAEYMPQKPVTDEV